MIDIKVIGGAKVTAELTRIPGTAMPGTKITISKPKCRQIDLHTPGFSYF